MADTAPPADGSSLTNDYMETMLRKQVVRTGVSSSNPAVVEGGVGFQTDTDALIVSSTTAWSTLLQPAFGAGTSYTPTLVQSGAVTKTVTQAMYIRTGRLITGNVLLTCTGAGTGANAVVIGLPVTAAGSANMPIGTGWLYDASATTQYSGTLLFNSSTTAVIVPNNVGLFSLGVVSFTAALASSDQVGIFFQYFASTDA